MVTYSELAGAVARNHRQSGTLRLSGTRFPVDYCLYRLEQGIGPNAFVADHPTTTAGDVRTVARLWLQAGSTADGRSRRQWVRQYADIALLRETLAELQDDGWLDLPERSSWVNEANVARCRQQTGRNAGVGTWTERTPTGTWIRQCVRALREASARIPDRPVATIQAREVAERLEGRLEETAPRA